MNETRIEGFVKSAELAYPLSNVTIEKLDSHNNCIALYSSGESGEWLIDSFEDGQTLIFSANGYVPKKYSSNPGKLVRLLKDELIGYQDRLWFYPGDTVDVCVHSPNAYKASLYRHGNKKEVIAEFKSLPRQAQQVPDTFFVETGLDWVKSFDYKLADNIKPGLYSLLLEIAGESRFAIPMVVSSANSKKKNKLVVLASTTTWQSYNIWGGRSRYRNNEYLQKENRPVERVTLFKRMRNLVKLFIPNMIVDAINDKWSKPTIIGHEWMHKRLSINRPFTNCSLEAGDWNQLFTNHLARAEWCILAWLETQEIEYDFISGADLHFKPEILDDYKAIILSTHCEYWSREMYKSLKNHHDNQGLWVLNLSGNSLFREIQFFDNGSTRCNSLDFSQTCDDESKLLGVRFTNEDYGTCAPYQVIDPSHWIFENAGIKTKGDYFGEVSLNRQTDSEDRYTEVNAGRPQQGEDLVGVGASGWETDKMTKTAPEDFKLVAKGNNHHGGADMVVREPEGSRGGVFSASSIVFGGSLPVDKVCSTVVKNVLNRILP